MLEPSRMNDPTSVFYPEQSFPDFVSLLHRTHKLGDWYSKMFYKINIIGRKKLEVVTLYWFTNFKHCQYFRMSLRRSG